MTAKEWNEVLAREPPESPLRGAWMVEVAGTHDQLQLSMQVTRREQLMPAFREAAQKRLQELALEHAFRNLQADVTVKV